MVAWRPRRPRLVSLLIPTKSHPVPVEKSARRFGRLDEKSVAPVTGSGTGTTAKAA